MYEDEHAGQGAQPGSTTTSLPEDRIELSSVSPVATKAAEQLKKPNVAAIDSEEAKRLSENLLSHYLHELDVQGENRKAMAEDEAFYDSKQWDSLDKAILEERGQEALVYNVIKTTINWVLGTERRGRADFKILPRRKEGAAAAERKTELIKYLSDVNHGHYECSDAFMDTVRAGVGFLESAIQDEDEGEPIYEGHASWRDIVWDSTSRKRDMRDARYQFRHRWMDLDHAQKFFPKRRGILETAAHQSYDFAGGSDNFGDDPMDQQEHFSQEEGFINVNTARASRKRVRLIEGWFKVPQMVDRMAGGDFSGEIFDPTSPGHQTEVMMGRAQVKARTIMRTHVMIFTVAGPVYFGISPYRHNKLPFTPMWCYRDAETMQPYGMIRDLKPMQRDVNKRLAKALAIMSSNKTIMEEGAVPDLDEYEEEVSRPDAIIVKRKGYELDINADRDLASAHLDIMSRSLTMIQATSGVTDENLGRETNAGSGKAIIARQEQGALATAIIFDNLRYARQVHGEKMLSLIEQFMTEERQFRITNQRGSPKYVTINDGDEMNDIVSTKADFIISEDDWNATIRQSQTEELLSLLQQLAPVAPQIVLAVIDLVVEKMDVANRDDIVKRIRQITGQTDPDADPNNPDPEEMQRMQAMQEQQEFQKRAAEAELSKTEADAAEKMAKAEKTKAEVDKLLASVPGDTLEQQRKALELAIETMNNRAAAPMADDLLLEAGVNIAPPALERIPMPPPPPPQPPQPQPVPMPV